MNKLQLYILLTDKQIIFLFLHFLQNFIQYTWLKDIGSEQFALQIRRFQTNKLTLTNKRERKKKKRIKVSNFVNCSSLPQP